MLKKIYNKYQRAIGVSEYFGRSSINAQYMGEEAANLLKEKLSSNKPLMIARFGANELNIVLNHHFINQGIVSNFSNVFNGIPYAFRYKKGILDNFKNVAGFFPVNKNSIEKYCELTLIDMEEIDVLGSWLNHERFVYPFMKKDHIRVRLRDLTPVTNFDNPWSAKLKDKKVLVIHPFQATIQHQYEKREFLFNNKDVLPNFDLITLKAVQSLAENSQTSGYKTWFDALEFMKEKVNSINFDIAIIGCGAYGMPLAAHIKRIGKQAFHLGGETQILFGIKGKRWEHPSYSYDKLFYNEHWTRPLAIDIPNNIEKVEGGCYW